jgi:hypothetical protein
VIAVDRSVQGDSDFARSPRARVSSPTSASGALGTVAWFAWSACSRQPRSLGFQGLSGRRTFPLGDSRGGNPIRVSRDHARGERACSPTVPQTTGRRPRTYIDTSDFEAASTSARHRSRGKLTLAWDAMRNRRRYVMIRHSLGAPGGRGGLDGDWMRPVPPVVLDASGAGAYPAVVPTARA